MNCKSNFCQTKRMEGLCHGKWQYIQIMIWSTYIQQYYAKLELVPFKYYNRGLQNILSLSDAKKVNKIWWKNDSAKMQRSFTWNASQQSTVIFPPIS